MSEATTDHRAPPHDTVMEQNVLGGLMVTPTALSRIPYLQPEDFYIRKNQLVFAAIQGMHEAGTIPPGEHVDLGLLYDRVKPDVTGSDLAELWDAMPSAAYITEYARVVKDKAAARQLLDVTSTIIRRTFEGESIADLTSKLGEEVANLTPAPEQVTPENLGLVLASDLEEMIQQDQEYIVHGLIPKGWLSLFLADPKCGKSMVVRNLIHAIMNGGQWLGREVEQQGHVLYLAWEEGPDDVWRHFSQMGLDFSTAPLVLSFGRNGTDPQRWAHWLAQAVEQVQPALVVIDTLARLIPFEEVNDYAKAMQNMTPLLEIARSSGAHIMALHHTRKSGGEHGSESMGSQAIYGSVDMMVRLTRQGDQRYISTDGRPHDRIAEPVAILWDDATGQISTGGTLADGENTSLEDEVCRLLEDAPAPMRLPEIRTALKANQNRVQRALLGLVKRGLVSQQKDGRTYLYRLEKYRDPGL